MNYKKYSNNSYNLHIINTDKFKTIMIKINFKKKLEKIDITKRDLLIKILLESNEQYKTRRDIEIECENLYGLGISGESNISGKYIISSFSSIFLNEKYTEKGMNNKSIDFLLNLIFKPLITNKQFDTFDRCKNIAYDEIISIKEDPKRYSLIRLFEEIDKNLFYNPTGYLEDLDSITNIDLYNDYLSMLKSDLIDIFIVGDVDNEILKKQIENSFSINTLKKKSESHFIEHKNIKSRAKTIVEDMKLEQAKLNIGYKLNNLTEFEKKYVMYIYSFILGGSPDSKLFKNVREKNSLCYNISSIYKPVFNMMIISSGINKSDYKKCTTIIKKEVNKMSKGDFDLNDIKAAQLTYINSLKDIEDYQPSIIKIFESHEYLDFDLLDERSKSILNVTKDDIIKLSKKINIDTIYLLGGNQ